MKKLLSFIIMALFTLSASAQYEPNTKWPYVYENFTDGTIYFDGNKKSVAKLNIHLLGNVLHYISPEGKIFQSTDNGVVRVEIGSDVYLFCGKRMMKLCASKGDDALLLLEKGDFDSLVEGTGAYGSSLNSSAARDLSSLDLGGLDKPELGRMLQEKNDGSIISIRPEYYFVINGEQVEATKKGLDKYFKDSKADESKAFQKANKIKWKDAESLAKILDFIQ